MSISPDRRCIIATVGLSIFDKLTQATPISTGVPSSFPDVLMDDDIGKIIKKIEDDYSTTRVIPKAGLNLLRPSDSQWKCSVSAEWDSIAGFCQSELSKTKVVFLATDTNEGVAAALTNAALIGGDIQLWGGPPNAPVHLDKATISGTMSAREIHVYRIPDLIPRETLKRGLGNFAAAIGHFATQGQSGNTWVCLSGGFKLQIPSLITACEYLVAANLIRGAFLKHEKSSEHYQLNLRPTEVISKDRLAARSPEDIPLWGFAFDNQGLTEVGLMLQTIAGIRRIKEALEPSDGHLK